MKKFVASVVLLSMFALTAITTAYAYEVNAGGGTWNYGVGSTYVWSNYYHGWKQHDSTAVGSYTSYSGKTNSGWWSKASAKKKSVFANKSYYNYY